MRGEDAAFEADSMQAGYFREYLNGERAELQRTLADHINRLEACLKGGSTRLVSHHRGCIRAAENELRFVDRMLARLDSRFPRKADR